MQRSLGLSALPLVKRRRGEGEREGDVSTEGGLVSHAPVTLHYECRPPNPFIRPRALRLPKLLRCAQCRSKSGCVIASALNNVKSGWIEFVPASVPPNIFVCPGWSA